MSLATTASVRAHSLLDRYDRPKGKRAKREAPRVTPIIIDDPYAEDFPAVLREPPARATTRNHLESEWHAPTKKPIQVLASARDTIANMLAHHVIDKAMFNAAREYQGIYETALSSRIKTVDPSMPPISGGRGRRAMDDAVAAAVDRMRYIEGKLSERHGSEAVLLVRGVLGEGSTIERFAMRRGYNGKPWAVWWGKLFNRSLRELAEISGFAVKGAYRNRAREERRREAERKRMEREDA